MLMEHTQGGKPSSDSRTSFVKKKKKEPHLFNCGAYEQGVS